MQIIVLAKAVPEVAEAELSIDDTGAALDTDELVFSINEWDSYALEEALRLKETSGGSVTVLSLGDEESEDVLRRALAMGADEAARIDDEDFAGSDPAALARIFAAAARHRRFDLVLTGVQSSDENGAQLGVLLAEQLGLPHATLATRIEVAGPRVLVHRELEQDAEQRVELPLPALITVQSGINQPRYVSVAGIRKVRGKTIEQLDRADLALEEQDVGLAASCVAERRLRLPEAAARAELLTGAVPEVCTRLAALLRERGGLR